MTEPPATLAACTCHQVSKTYVRGSSSVRALVDVDLVAPPARITALFGPSGSGKSTLLRLLAAVDRPDTGEIMVGATSVPPLSSRRRRLLRRHQIGYVFQDPSHNLIGYLTAREQLTLAAQLRGAEEEHPDDLLALVGLADRASHHPGQLSGGEQQRLAFAAAVSGGPVVVLGDEPTAELDATSGARLLSSILDMSEGGTSFVIASHDPAVREVAHVVVELDHGRVTR